LAKNREEVPQMPVQKLKDFLDDNGVKYTLISHSPAFTAQEIAESVHIPGKWLAKTVMVKIDGKMAMAVLPATCRVDLDLLKSAAGVMTAELATEEEFQYLFRGCAVGAMPPFGNLYGMVVYVADVLREDEEIAFNAGTHSELIRLKYRDFERLVKPTVAKISRR
jgi:Ala-tRNA(Pro) deacylase